MIQDFELIEKNGYYDFNITQSGDIQTIDSLETAIYLSLFNNRRADDTDAADPKRKQGWMGDLLRDEPHNSGSKLWLLDGGRVNTQTSVLAESYIFESLQWLINDGIVTNISVEATPKIDFLSISIIIKSINQRDSTFNFDLFKNTFA